MMIMMMMLLMINAIIDIIISTPPPPSPPEMQSHSPTTTRGRTPTSDDDVRDCIRQLANVVRGDLLQLPDGHVQFLDLFVLLGAKSDDISAVK